MKRRKEENLTISDSALGFHNSLGGSSWVVGRGWGGGEFGDRMTTSRGQTIALSIQYPGLRRWGVRGGEPGVRPLQPKLKFQLFPNSSFGFAGDFCWRFQIRHCHKKIYILERIHWEFYRASKKKNILILLDIVSTVSTEKCLAINYFK
jgi:hypothetical protein